MPLLNPDTLKCRNFPNKIFCEKRSDLHRIRTWNHKNCYFQIYWPTITLQIFCLQNTQMFVCVINSRTNIGCFYMYFSVMDNKYFHVVSTLNQTLNSLKNKYILSNLQKFFCCFNKLFSYWQNFLSVFAGYEIWFWF